MSTIKANKWENPDGSENFKCRAWVNFNGTGTVAIRASGNVSSITDTGVGLYTVNFTTAMPDADYGINCTAQGNGNIGRGYGALIDAPQSGTTPTTSAVQIAIGLGATATAPDEVRSAFRSLVP